MTMAMTPFWLMQAYTSTVIIYSRIVSGTDEYNNPTYETTAVSTCRGLLAPLGGSEIHFGRAGAADNTLFLPAEVAGKVDNFSAFDVDGQSYEAVSPPEVWKSMFQPAFHHVEIDVVRSTA